MIKRSKENQKFLMKVLIASALIILFVSLEALFYAKDADNFKAYQDLVADFTYDSYINLIIFNLIISVLNPIIISLTTYFTIDRVRVNQVYKLFFGFSTLLATLYTAMQLRWQSLFYYLVIILNIYLLYTIVTKERT